MVRRLVQEASNGQVTLIAPPRAKNAPPKMTLHPLISKGGAFVLKLGLVPIKKDHLSVVFFYFSGNLNHVTPVAVAALNSCS